MLFVVEKERGLCGMKGTLYTPSADKEKIDKNKEFKIRKLLIPLASRSLRSKLYKNLFKKL